jgi:hypothetical protein
MALSFTALTASQAQFVERVCSDLNRNYDPAQVGVYDDGTCSPNGEKFAAERLGHSWNVCFDFGAGDCYHTHVQLPVDWYAEWCKQTATADEIMDDFNYVGSRRHY